MSLEINLTNVQSKAVVVSNNQTAVNDANYTVVANSTFTDPSPVEGKGYRVFVRNGTATINAVAYTVGTSILRLFHSGSWVSYVSLPDSNFVPTTRTINGYDLSANRTLTASDVGAVENSSDAILSALGWWQIHDTTPGSNSSGTSNTISKSIEIGTITDVLNIEKVTFTKTGTNAVFTGRVYLSEVNNNIGGTAILLATYTSTNSANTSIALERLHEIIGSNINGINASTSNSTDRIQSGQVRLNTPILTASPLYLIFTTQCNSGSDVASFQSAYIKNF
jgi:hypothetical protein